MRYQAFIIGLFIYVLGSCSSKDATNPLVDIDQEVRSHSTAYANLKQATQTIGHRLTGSANGVKAEELSYQLFAEYGFDSLHLSYMPFEADVWSRGKLSFEVAPLMAKAKGDKYSPIPAVSLAHTPVEVDMESEIVDLGNGLPEDYEQTRQKVKGNLVLVYLGVLPGSGGSKNLHRSEKTALAIKHGASGIVFYNSVKGGILLTGTASINGKLITIPAICIDYESGMALKERLAQKRLKARVNMTNTFEPVSARNIIATIKGTTYPDEKIVLGAHLDSWDLATGAIDNGIGAFSVIDIARTFKKLGIKPKRTIQFVLFMGEEQGLLGSWAMVNKLREKDQMGNIRYMFNLDMSMNPKGFNVFGREEGLPFITALGEQLKAIDNEYANKNESNVWLHSDHQPFMMYGVPVVSVVNDIDDHLFSCYHSACDDMDLVDEEQLVTTIRRSAMLLHLLANADSLPSKTYESEATKTFFINNGFEQKMKIAGDWLW
jgi:carboxypeptidase Q